MLTFISKFNYNLFSVLQNYYVHQHFKILDKYYKSSLSKLHDDFVINLQKQSTNYLRNAVKINFIERAKVTELKKSGTRIHATTFKSFIYEK